MFNIEEEAQRSESFARDLYQITEHTLMAHTIRAFERFMRTKYGYKKYMVKVFIDDKVARRMQHEKRCSYIVFGDEGANIFVDACLNNDRKRVCVAHELYHIYLAAVHGFYRNGQLVKMRSLPKGTESEAKSVEDFCDVFANRLCFQHNQFYQNANNIENKLRFKEIPRSSYKTTDLD